MSQVPNDENLRKARERVMQLAREIESLSREALPPEEFFPQFLNRVVGAVGAQAGAVWLLNGPSISLVAGVQLESVGLTDPAIRQKNDRVLGEILSTGEACTLSQGDGSGVELPTSHMLVLCALHKDKKCVGVVELFQRADAPEEARAGYLQFLEQMSGYASRYLEGKGRRNQEADEAPTGFWQDLEPFTLRLQQSLESEEIAEIAASDGRLLLECDRLSIVTQRGAKVSVRSVSGQTSVNPRANLIRAMAALGKQVIAMGEPLLYTGRIEDLAPQVEKPLANFVQESTSRMVYLVPLFENLRIVKPDQEAETGFKSAAKRNAIGCLVIEQVAESEPGPALVQRAELIADHIAAALHNARSHEHIFGIRVWRKIGRTVEWFHGRRLATLLAVLGVIAVVILAMVLVPWEYRVEAQGKLMPVEQQALFAPETGQIVELNIDGGEVKDAGAPLLKIESEQLTRDLEDATSKLAVARARLTTLDSEIAIAEIAKEFEKADELRGEKKTTEVEVIYLQQKVNRLTQRQSELLVSAPFTGLIPAINLRQKLENRPVQQGQHLLNIMNHQGQWHLEVQLPEKRAGHLLRAIAADREAGGDGSLEGEYTLATNPEQRYKCRLNVVAKRTSVHPEHGTVVELYVEPVELPEKRIGAEVRVKLNCGTRSLGYCLFGDVVEFIQKYTWF